MTQQQSNNVPSVLKWIVTFILLWFIYQVRHVFPPILVGAIIAYLLLPLVHKLSNSTRLSIGAATGIIYILLVGTIVIAISYLAPSIMHELQEMLSPDSKREIVRGALQQVSESLPGLQINVADGTEQILHSLSEGFGNPSEIMHLGGLLSHGFLATLVCFVSSIYFTLDAPKVGRFFLRYVPEHRRASIIELTGQMNMILLKYVQGQILLIIIMSTVAWVFLHFVIHMKYALPIALLSGTLEIIPVLGPILATGIAAMVGISQFGSTAGVAIIAFYTLARWLEDYVIIPKIIGHAVELHPLAVIFAVLCGEHLAGALGMLIAIPVAACVKLAIDFFYFGKLPAEVAEAAENAETKGKAERTRKQKQRNPRKETPPN